jgi:hypothetical protein
VRRTRRFQDRGGAAADEDAARRHVPREPERRAALVEEHDVERKPHPERVHRPAAADQKRVAVRGLAAEREAEQAGAETGCLVDDHAL